METNINSYPKVSVAIISYNQKTFLNECIISILKQDYSNLEIVVADDSSIDGSVELVEEYILKYPLLFKLIKSETNSGITVNSNRAFFACTGKYISWMGGDDLMMPGKIQKQVKFLEENKEYVLCYHNLDVFESTTNKTIRYFNSGSNSHRPYTGGANTLIEYGTFLGACSVMTRTISCPLDGFNNQIKVASDWLFWIETAVKGEIGYINEVLGRYRRHSKNVTNNKNDLSEQYLTISIIRKKYPFLIKSVERSTFKLNFIQIVREIKMKNNLNSFKYIKSFVKISLRKPLLIIWLIKYLYLLKRNN